MVVERKRDVGVRVLVLCSPLSVVCRRPVVAPLRVGRCWLVLSAGASLGTLPGVCWLGCHLPGVALALDRLSFPYLARTSRVCGGVSCGQRPPCLGGTGASAFSLGIFRRRVLLSPPSGLAVLVGYSVALLGDPLGGPYTTFGCSIPHSSFGEA